MADLATQADVHYGAATVSSRRCGLCTMFVKGTHSTINRCTAVQSIPLPIVTYAVCDLFKRKE